MFAFVASSISIGQLTNEPEAVLIAVFCLAAGVNSNLADNRA